MGYTSLIRYLPIKRKYIFPIMLLAIVGTGMVRSGAFDSIANSLKQTTSITGNPAPAGNIAPGSVQVGFSPGNAESIVVSTINNAQEIIRVAAYSFTSRPIAAALVAANKRGVKVFAVLDKSQKTAKYSSATFIANAGIPVRIDNQYAIMHNKFLVVDDKTVETGSFNYTKSAAKRNAENVIVMHDVPRIAATYAREWVRLWKEADPYSARN